MFFSFFRSSAGGAFDTLRLAARATFQPRETAATIRLGDRNDFNQRFAFFLKIVAIVAAFQAIVAWSLGLSALPQSIDAIGGYIAPLFVFSLYLMMYVPLRLLRMTRIPFSHFFQAAATTQGVSLFMMPFALLAPVAARLHYGLLESGSDVIASAKYEAPGPHWRLCDQDFNSMMCYGFLALPGLELSWAYWIQQAAAWIAIIPMAILVKSATGISYWKQLFGLLFSSFLLMLGAMVMIGRLPS